jgi:hypothetical protein
LCVRIFAISNVLPLVTSTSKKEKSRISSKPSGSRPFDHDGSGYDLDDHHLQVHGDPRFVFDNEDMQHFH